MEAFDSYARISAIVTRLGERVAVNIDRGSRPEWEIRGFAVFQFFAPLGVSASNMATPTPVYEDRFGLGASKTYNTRRTF